MKTQIIPGKISFLTRFSLVLMLFAFLIVLQPNDAQAEALPADLDITGSAWFDAIFAQDNFFDATQSGDIYKIVGGSIGSSPFTDTTVNNPNPQEGTLTQTGDGVGTSVNASAGLFENFGVGVDLELMIENLSPTSQYQVTVKAEFSNSVNTNGPFTNDASGYDAFADSEFSVQDSSGEVFFTDLVSDTIFGNEENGTLLSSYGGPLTDLLFSDTFDVILNPLATETILGFYTLRGGVFDDPTWWNLAAEPGFSDVDFSAFLSVDSVEYLGEVIDPNAVPIPATLPLLGFGLAGLAAIRKRFRG